MVREYKRKNKCLQWSEESMESATASVLQGHVSMRAAAALYKVPFTTLFRRIQEGRIHQGDNQQVSPPIRKRIGHPTILSADQERDLVDRLKSLSNRGLGHTSLSIRRAVYQYAKMHDIIVPWSEETKMAGKDWFLSFMKRHKKSISLRKPEALSKARARGVNKESVQKFYDILKTVIAEFGLQDKPQNIFNVDESGFPMNNRPEKVVGEKGKREVVSLTNLERGENVTVVVACNATGTYIPPFIIFKGKRMREEYKMGTPPGTEVAMSETGYINEDLFLTWLKHFNLHRSQGRCLLILDGHSSHLSLQCLEYCVEHQIELLCLPPHTTHVLQPLDRTVFKPLKAYYHQEGNIFIHNNPQASITKFVFGKIFNTAWRNGANVGNAIKGFECTGIHPLNPNKIPPHKFLPSSTFLNDETHPVTTEPEVNPEPSTPSNNSQSQSPSTPSTSFSTVLPTPTKLSCTKRARRQKNSACHLTSSGNLELTRGKRKLKFENALNTKSKEPRTMQSRQKKIQNVNEDSASEDELDEENVPCGFCCVKYNDPRSIKKGDWIRCNKCNVWFHEICVGAAGRKQFRCGKCI